MICGVNWPGKRRTVLSKKFYVSSGNDVGGDLEGDWRNRSSLRVVKGSVATYRGKGHGTGASSRVGEGEVEYRAVLKRNFRKEEKNKLDYCK